MHRKAKFSKVKKTWQWKKKSYLLEKNQLYKVINIMRHLTLVPKKVWKKSQLNDIIPNLQGTSPLWFGLTPTKWDAE